MMTIAEIERIAYALFPENWDAIDDCYEDGTPVVRDANKEKRDEWIEVEMERNGLNSKP